MFLRTLCAWVSSLFALGLLAMTAGNAQAACYTPQQALPAQTISDFLGNPSQMLQQYPGGGAQMITQIRDLAASDPATLQPILKLVASANTDQKTAIGSALGQAAKICVKSPLGGPGAGPGGLGGDQAYATQIQEGVAQIKDPILTTAYAAVTGEQPLGGVGGGPGGVLGGGGGGQTSALPGLTGSTGGPQAIVGGSVPTGTFGFSSGVSTANSPPLSTISTSVSP